MPFNKGHVQALRNYIGKVFQFLPSTQKAQVQSALVDFDNLDSFTSVLTSSDILARKPETFDLKIDITGQNFSRTPQYTNDIFPWAFNAASENNVYGGLITWQRQNDPRIDRYEIEISNNQNFNDYTTVYTKDFQYAFSGIQTTKYVRLRGVRVDGTVTNWSNVVSFTPKVTDLRVHSFAIEYSSLLAGGFYPTILNQGAGVTPYPSGIYYAESPYLTYSPVNGSASSVVWATSDYYFTYYAVPPDSTTLVPWPPYALGRIEFVKQINNVITPLYTYVLGAFSHIGPGEPTSIGPIVISHEMDSNHVPYDITLFWRLYAYYSSINFNADTRAINVVEFGI